MGRIHEKLPDVELKNKLQEINNITLYVAMDKIRKWSCQVKKLEQALMWLKKSVGTGLSPILLSQ